MLGCLLHLLRGSVLSAPAGSPKGREGARGREREERERDVSFRQTFQLCVLGGSYRFRVNLVLCECFLQDLFLSYCVEYSQSSTIHALQRREVEEGGRERRGRGRKGDGRRKREGGREGGRVGGEGVREVSIQSSEGSHPMNVGLLDTTDGPSQRRETHIS